MNRCCPLCGLKKLLLGFLVICIVLSITKLSDGDKLAKATPLAAQPTTTELFPDKLEVHTFDAVYFTVHVSANDVPVSEGSMTVKEATDDFYSVSGEVVNGLIILEWVAQPWTPTGWCTFIATYEGTTAYAPSSGTAEVCVGDPISTGLWATETTIEPDMSTVWCDSTVNFSVSITILGGAFPFFSGGYISLVDVTENIVLQRQDVVAQAAVTYTMTFTQVIPSWYSSGIHSFEAHYTGSAEADHAPSTGVCTLQILVNGYSLSLNANNTTINREDSSLLLSASIDGDDPTDHLLTLRAIQNTTQILLDETNVTSRDYLYEFTPVYSYQLGLIDFELSLNSPLTGELEAQETIIVTIIDTVSILYEFNAEEYGEGDIVRLTAYSVETDMPTQPVQANITIKDTNIPLELGPISTDTHGRAEFEWQLPEGTVGGVHLIEIQAVPFSPYYTETTANTEIVVRGDITFVLVYPTSVQRGMGVVLNCTILVDSTIVNEGQLTLRYDNSTTIWSSEVTGPMHYTYTVSLSHTLGPLTLVWDYEGTEVFRPANQSLSLTVFSQPHFDVLTSNCTNVVRGKPIRINGQLLDETGQGVLDAPVTLWDNGNLIGTVTTIENGGFFYEYIIPTDAAIGLHVIEAQFTGDYTLFQLPASNLGACTISVHAPLRITMPDSLTGEEITSIQIVGTPFEEITLSWSPLNTSPAPWYDIGNLSLDSDGQGHWLWLVPMFKGNISVRATNLMGEMVFVDATILVKAQITLINFPDETEVQTNVLFEGDVSEEYRLFLDHTAISSWQPAGTFQHIVNFQTRGSHTFTIQTQGEYVVAENFSHPIVVFEPLTAFLDLPSSVSASYGATAYITIEGLHEGPISGLLVRLIVNEIEWAVTTTSTDGNATFTLSLSPNTYNITCETQGQSSYYRDVCVSHLLTVRSTTQLTLSHTNAFYYETVSVMAVLQDELGLPVAQQPIDILISDDQGNTWISFGTVITDNNGTCQIAWFNTLTPGKYLFRGNFTGSVHFDATLTTIEVEIDRNDILVFWEPLSGEYGSEIMFNASLTTPSGLSVTDSLNMNLMILYDDQWILLTIADSNEAGFIVFLLNLDFLPGNYTLEVAFSGNTYFRPGAWNCVLQILPKPTAISLEQLMYETTYGESQNISVNVTTLIGTSISGVEVSFSVQQGEIVYFEITNQTNQKGFVSFHFPISFPQGTYTLHFNCLGNNTHAPSSTNAELVVLKGTAQLEPKIKNSTFQYGANVSWSAYVTDIQGEPIAGVPITFSTSLTGIYWDSWGTVETNTTGYAGIEICWLQETQIHYGNPGVYTLKIIIEDNPYVGAQQEARVISVTKGTVILTLENCTITRSNTAIIQGTLMSSTAVPIYNAPITLFWNATVTGEWEELLVVSTNQSGRFHAELPLSQQPQICGIKAEYSGDTFHNMDSIVDQLRFETGPVNTPHLIVSPSDIALGEVIDVEISDIDPFLTPKAKLLLTTDNFVYEQQLDISSPLSTISIHLNESFPLSFYSISLQLQLNNGSWIKYEDLTTFVISTNSLPTLDVSWDRLLLDDGEIVNYTIIASDSLGIRNVSIVRENETILIDLPVDGVVSGELRFFTPGTYWVQIIAVDRAGAKAMSDFSFTVNGKGPEFLNVYPSTTLLAELHSPLLFEVETLVSDPSGIASVTLYSNSTQYPLTLTDDLWSTSLELSNATYTLWLIATDIHGIDSRFELGQITPSLDETSIPNNGEPGSEESSSHAKNNPSPFLLLGVLSTSFVLLIGNFLLKWRKRNAL